MDFQIKYLSWKTKVDSYVKYLTNLDFYDYDNLKQFYNNGFEDKIVSLIISKNIINTKKYNRHEWWNELDKVFNMFEINIKDNIKSQIVEKHFPIPPLEVACLLLKDYGYLSLQIFSNQKIKKIDDINIL